MRLINSWYVSVLFYIYLIIAPIEGKHLPIEQKAILFPKDNFAELGSPCKFSGGGIGACYPISNCPGVKNKILNQEGTFSDFACEVTSSGIREFVCCPITHQDPAIDISPPDDEVSEPYGCGRLYYEVERNLRRLYVGNDTAKSFIEQGYTITPLDFYEDDLSVFEISNGTYSDTYYVARALPGPGGKDARRVVGVYMALIGDGTNWYCDGVLINRNWILTAAHCFGDRDPISGTVVRLGEYNWQDDSYSTREYPLDYSVVKAVVHPDYSYPSVYHDLMLLKLNASRPQLRQDIYPVCLPWGEEATKRHVGDVLILTGWGATVHLGPHSPILQEINVTVFDSSRCERGYSTLPGYKDEFPNGINDETTLCAGDKEGGKDACQGDSGGPIVYLSKSNTTYESESDFSVYTERYTLAGIVSTGFGCGLKEFPGIYVPINNPIYLSWIKKVAFATQ